MHRFYLPPDRMCSAELELEGAEAHHCVHVLRLRPGARVHVHDGAGTIAECVIERATGRAVVLRVDRRRTVPPHGWSVCLVQAITKSDSFEWTIQKVTELGVQRIVPVITERTVVRLRADTIAAKLARWRQTTIEAMKQCGTPWLPIIEPPVEFSVFVSGMLPAELDLVGVLDAGAALIRTWFEEYRSVHGRAPLDVRLWIGPEGDFTPAEIDMLRARGVRSFTLGPNVLRAETAAICAAAIVIQEFLLDGALGH